MADLGPNLCCIWCGCPTTGNEPPEHIVPEAIGCPDGFILNNGEVCAKCNHGLAHLDRALIHDLEAAAFLAGVSRKGGRSPKISSYANLKAGVNADGPYYFINMDPTSTVSPMGESVSGFKGKPRDVKASFSQDNRKATVKFPLEFGRSPKVARALVKLGAEYLCWAQGRSVASSAIAGGVADFVINGKGYRPVILVQPSTPEYEHRFGQIARLSANAWCCYFKLAHTEVMVDFSHELLAFKNLAATLWETTGAKGWTTLPIDAVREKDGSFSVRAE